MIPKIIHYCWFGQNPLPSLALECIASWKKFLPDYEIWMWVEDGLEVRDERLEKCDDRVEVSDEGLETSLSTILSDSLTPNYSTLTKASPNPSTLTDIKVCHFDVNMIPYTSEAYKQKKYAFVSDFARFWIIYNYGGIYFDTDVEVIGPMDDIIEGCLSNHEGRIPLIPNLTPLTYHHGFMGFELDPDCVNTPGRYAPRFAFAVNPGVGFGMTKGHPFINKMLDHYANLKFELPPADISWYKTIVAYTTELLCKEGLKNVKGIQTINVNSDSLISNLSPLTSDSSNHSTQTSNHSSITIYPSEYFAPINVITGRLHITENTRTIHRYMGSWNVGKGLTVKSLTVNGIIQVVRHYFPEWVLIMMNKIKRRKYRIKG